MVCNQQVWGSSPHTGSSFLVTIGLQMSLFWLVFARRKGR